MAALQRQKIDIPVEHQAKLIVYHQENRAEAISQARELRRMGGCVELALWDSAKSKDDYTAYAKRNQITEVEFL